jgi:ribosomal protein S6E (S10)
MDVQMDADKKDKLGQLRAKVDALIEEAKKGCGGTDLEEHNTREPTTKPHDGVVLLEGMKSGVLEDLDLLRYLKARKWDVDAALSQLLETMHWRSNGGVGKLLCCPDPHEDIYQNYTPHLYFGHDKEGRPISWDRTGQVRVAELLQQLTPEDVNARHVRHMELQIQRMKESSAEQHKPVTQLVWIMDLKGLSMKPDSQGTKLFKNTITIDQTYYPERLGHLFIINAPWVFKPIWAIIRPWIDPNTREKIHICGENYHAVLKEFIDSDQIPKEYGGTSDAVVPSKSVGTLPVTSTTN